MRIRLAILGWISCVILVLTGTGCSNTLKPMLIDQLVGFATAITGAATTSLIQSLFHQTS